MARATEQSPKQCASHAGKPVFHSVGNSHNSASELLASYGFTRVIHPCRGGVPLVFPQYGRASGVAAYAGVGSGAVPSHGFLQRLHWTLVEAGVSPPHAPDPAPCAVFAAEWDEDTYAMWPHRFGAIYTVRAGPA